MRKWLLWVFGMGLLFLAFPHSATAQYFEWVTVNGTPVVVPFDPYGSAGGSGGKCKLDDCKDVDPLHAAKSPWDGCTNMCSNPCTTTNCPSKCGTKQTCEACCGTQYQRHVKDCGGGRACQDVHQPDLTTCNRYCDPDQN
jgi:hypothetical protein